MPASAFYEYVTDSVLLSLKDGEALIGLPNARARDWLENRFATKIRRALSSCLGGQTVTVKFVDLTATHEDNRTAAAG
jgi:chromosomal replication initiation ATPase DnaA